MVVGYQPSYRRRIGTVLVIEFGLQPSCLCSSRIPAVVSQAYRRGAAVVSSSVGILARHLSSSSACSRRVKFEFEFKFEFKFEFTVVSSSSSSSCHFDGNAVRT